MDPDANLTEQLQIAQRLSADMDSRAPRSANQIAVDALRLAELIGALDSWIKSGGFLPRQWRGQ